MLFSQTSYKQRIDEAVGIPLQHRFASLAARDAYFVSAPGELYEGIPVLVDGILWVYDGAALTWTQVGSAEVPWAKTYAADYVAQLNRSELEEIVLDASNLLNLRDGNGLPVAWEDMEIPFRLSLTDTALDHYMAYVSDYQMPTQITVDTVFDAGGSSPVPNSALWEENLTGQVDGVTQTFTMSRSFPAGSTYYVLYNGQVNYLGEQFTVSGTQVTTLFDTPPAPPDDLRVWVDADVPAPLPQAIEENVSSQADGSNLVFVLSHPYAPDAEYDLLVNGVHYYNGQEFLVSGDTVTLYMSPPLTGDDVRVRVNGDPVPVPMPVVPMLLWAEQATTAGTMTYSLPWGFDPTLFYAVYRNGVAVDRGNYSVTSTDITFTGLNFLNGELLELHYYG
jgi:hypothetical protein